MTTPLDRVRFGITVLAIVFVGAVIGYHLLGYPWIEAIWLVVVTIAGVGYSERSQQVPSVQLISSGDECWRSILSTISRSGERRGFESGICARPRQSFSSGVHRRANGRRALGCDQAAAPYGE